MLFYTHLTFAFLVGLVFMPAQIIWVMLGALIPDIDNPSSKINNTLKLTKIFGYAFKHRGFCHSVWFGIIVFLFFQWLIPKYALGIFLGFISHIVLDGLTSSGIQYFYPLKSLNLKGFIATGSIGEKLVLGLIVFVIIIKLF